MFRSADVGWPEDIFHRELVTKTEDIFQRISMAKHTSRDRVWNATLEIAEEKAEHSGWGRRFDVDDVVDRIGEDAPSRRTVRDVIATIAELDRIQNRSRQGQYEPLDSAGG